MKRVLALAFSIYIGWLLPTMVVAQSARSDATLHPGHQGVLSSGKEYPGKPATDFHDGIGFTTGPGGYAEQQSGGANAQRSSTGAPAVD